jgi:glutamyl/glutaminyl-tRNA synthetase
MVADKVPHAIRMKVPKGETVLNDLVMGEIGFDH